MAGTDGYLLVQTTTDTRAEAMELSRAAVTDRLAACAQVSGPVASTYWWDERLERTEEWVVLFKLPADRYEELAAFIAERHSYDEPEIVAVPVVAGSAAYLNWVREETRPGSAAPLPPRVLGGHVSHAEHRRVRGAVPDEQHMVSCLQRAGRQQVIECQELVADAKMANARAVFPGGV